MQGAQPIILITRPEPGASRLAQALGVRCPQARVLQSPVMRIRYMDAPVEIGDRAVILTSQNALHWVAQTGAVPAGTVAYCVGARTTARARELGLIAHQMGDSAGELVARLTDAPPPARLIHLRGAQSRGDIAATLTRAGLPCAEQVVYAQDPVPLTQAAQSALQDQTPVILPLYSPRSATLLAGAARAARAPIYTVAISTAANTAWTVPQTRARHVAKRPSADCMLDTIVAVFDAVQNLEG